MPSVNRGSTAEKILARVKGLRDVMWEDEEPLVAIPAIWDGGQADHSNMCEVIVTNQRLLGYYQVTFPRERGFLEEFALHEISAVSLRRKSFEPLFRELLVSDGQHNVYIRASRKQIETLYTTLRLLTDEHVAQQSAEGEAKARLERAAPAFGRQEIRRQFERSPLAIVILLMGGLTLEVLAAALWVTTHSAQVGTPLFAAGLIAVITAILLRRARR